jgi:hypothetical protein
MKAQSLAAPVATSLLVSVVATVPLNLRLRRRS